MMLYKVDTGAWTVREVVGEPWPGKDSDGERTYDNTHFTDEGAAWQKLEREALAFVEIAARAVTRVREDLAARERDTVEAALALEKVRSAIATCGVGGDVASTTMNTASTGTGVTRPADASAGIVADGVQEVPRG